MRKTIEPGRRPTSRTGRQWLAGKAFEIPRRENLKRDQCAAADVPFLFKQWGGASQPEIKAKGRALDGVIHDGYPKGALISTLS